LNSLPPLFSFISPPIPEIVSTGIIFPFIYMCTQYLHYIHPPIPFLYHLRPSNGTNSRTTCRNFSVFLFLDFVGKKEKKFTFLLV
jgi:hypothetical protein